MFSWGMDYAKETSETAAGTALIPTRFVWPYGGESVLLSGSFTGWSGHYPMTPVEGCPTVFQTICSLPPGYHQYKFVVDGEWRHDEHQPFENGNYGTVNTVFLARESDYVPGILNPQMHSGSNMDVDNEAFQRLVRVSGGPLPEALPRVSEADLEVSRHRITIFLSTHMAYELLPESGKVIALDVDLPVKQAFHILHEQGIPMAPLWDFCKGQFVGVLSALDFIMIIRELGSHGSNLTEEELETHTISAWKDAKSYLSRQIDGNGRLFPRQLVHAGPDENLKDVALKILQNNVATVPVILLFHWWIGWDYKKLVRRLWRALPSIALWSFWKLRNECMFNGVQPCGSELCETIKIRFAMWVKASSKGFMYSTMELINNLDQIKQCS